MTNYNDGKIHGWNGGECPVHPETEVEVWFRGYTCGKDETAFFWSWQHDNDDGDVIAFRVIKEYREPKVIWVNEYAETGFYSHYTTKEEATNKAAPNATRIAVKYQEVIE